MDANQMGKDVIAKTGQPDDAETIKLQHKFLCGISCSVNKNIFFVDDSNTIIYPCGHNIVFYNMEDRSQKYIQGIEGSECITALDLSPSKKLLAVCERAERAICRIFDTSSFKRRKVLTSFDYKSKEFLSVNFSPTAEKTHLVTLTGEPDIQVIIWAWDKGRCIAQQQITSISGNMSVNQCSFHIQDQNCVVVTGNGIFRYFRIGDNNSLKTVSSQIAKKESHISNNLTCHNWLPDGRFIVCTDQGEIMLLEPDGSYRMQLETPGDGFHIECAQTFSKGFIIAGDSGQIYIYEKSEEPKNPYNSSPLLAQQSDKAEYHQLIASVMSSRIKCMTLSAQEDQVVFTTENNQIMKAAFSIERANDDCKYEFAVFPFHSRAIQGMDICIKKNLIATCSIDKTVRIWNNHAPGQFSLEICELFNDEAYSVAFHPTGLHIIVGFTDRIKMMNVFKDTLKSFQTIGIKGCREIRFSNGGHLFACASQNHINVYKFYTGENTQDMIFKAHHGPVRCIHWFDDDWGFISGGWDGNVYSWKLNLDKNDPKDQNPQVEFGIKNFQFASVANKPESRSTIYAAGVDKTIKTIEGGKLALTFEAGVNISQIQLMHGGRALFAGVCENDKPGSIQVIDFEFNKLFEVQAHSLPVERLRVSYDNGYLYSAGQDGMFGVFQIIDNMPGKKDTKEHTSNVNMSPEILMLKDERDKFLSDIEHLKNKIEIAKQNREAEAQQALDRKQKQINDIEQDIQQKEHENQRLYEELYEAKKEMDRMNRDKMGQIQQEHEIEKERRRQDYADKMDADQQRFNELQAQKDEDTRKFEERLNELSLYHEKIIKELRQDQKIQLDRQIQETNRLKENIEHMITNHKNEREKIENDTWERIDVLKDKNKEELANIIDQGMQSKCKLTIVMNDLTRMKSDQQLKQNDIKQKQQELQDKLKVISTLEQQQRSQDDELKEREKTIKDKDKRIIDLKKKTQELEKFKFVLDYKIKELKRDIGPRELEIQQLNEQTNKMRQELKHFNRVNQNLALIVDDLRMRQEGLTNEVQDLRTKLDEQEAYKKKFRDDVYETLHHTADYKKLKAGVVRLHKVHVKEEARNETGDTDVNREYQQKRRYLEQNVTYLKTLMSKDQSDHKKENSKIMHENVYLLSEINDQCKEKHALKQKIRENKMRISELTGNAPMDNDGALFEGDIERELNVQDNEIKELQRVIEEYSQSNEMLKQQIQQMGVMHQQPMDEQQLLQMQHQQEMMMQQQQQQQMDPVMEMDPGAMDPAMDMDMPGGADGIMQPPVDQQVAPAAAPANGGEKVPPDMAQAEPPGDRGGQGEPPADQPPGDMEGDKPPG